MWPHLLPIGQLGKREGVWPSWCMQTLEEVTVFSFALVRPAVTMRAGLFGSGAWDLLLEGAIFNAWA